MGHETVVMIFVVVAAVAIVSQALLMFGVYTAIKQIHTEIEGIRAEIRQRLDTLIGPVTHIVSNSREPIKAIVTNLAEVSRIILARSNQMNAVVSELIDRSRLEVIRIDQMLSTLVSKVENTANAVEKNVMAPIHEVSAVIKGLRIGLEALFGRQRAPASKATQDDQMFI